MSTTSLRPDDTLPDVGAIAEPRPEGRLRDVGPYQLLHELAQGGMGRVYLARERGGGGETRLVALKRIHNHLARQRSFVHMFLDEARIASRIHHPHVCTVFDFGRADDAYFIAMEYLRGLPFSEILRALGTEPPSASPRRYALGAHLLAQACEGLHAAHELRDLDGNLQHVVHRDVSPHNLFVTFSGTLRVLDFGIARAVDRLAESTTGRVKGKFAYMAPEQALGRAVDRRADVFSVGVVLWELCTLKRLFKRDSPAETVLNVVGEPVPRPSEKVPDVPPELERICMRALSKDPNKRYATARQMGRALTRAGAAIGPPVNAGDVAEFMARLFPGAYERDSQLLQAHGEATEVGGEVSNFRSRRLRTVRSRRRLPAQRQGVPAILALVLAAAAATVAFVIARVTQPTSSAVRQLPTSLSQPNPEPEPTAPVLGSPVTVAVGDRPAPSAFPRQPEPDVAVVAEAPRALPPLPIEPESEAPAPPRVARRRPSSPRDRSPPSLAPGQVRVGGPMEVWDAPIVFRGRELGTVPGTVRLPAGAHQIEVRVAGRPPIRRHVEVRSGQVTRVTLR